MNKLTKNINKQFYPTYMYGLGGFLKKAKDVGLGIIDTQLGTIGLNDIITDEAYSNQKAADISSMVGQSMNKLSSLGMNFLVPGAGSAKSIAQSTGINTYKNGGNININPSKKGTFTAAATKHNKSVQEFARQVLTNKDNYSPSMVKKANFARNASKWHKEGGKIIPINTQLLSTDIDNSLLPINILTKDKINTLKSLSKYYDFQNSEKELMDSYQQDGVLMSNPLRDIVNESKKIDSLKVPNQNYKRKVPKLFEVGGFIPTRLQGTTINSGETHEQSLLGGVPIGKNALVEDGEFIYTRKNGEKYVFSNRY